MMIGGLGRHASGQADRAEADSATFIVDLPLAIWPLVKPDRENPKLLGEAFDGSSGHGDRRGRNRYQ